MKCVGSVGARQTARVLNSYIKYDDDVYNYYTD